MLMPKRVKFRKMQPGRHRGKGLAYSGNYVAFGEYGLMSLEHAWITSRQIEAARRAITGYVKRGGKVWIRIFPDHPVTRRPPEVRMGSGKGSVDHYIAVIKPGRVMFEITGIPTELAHQALQRAAQKLPVLCKVVGRDDAELEVSGESERVAGAAG